MFLKTLKSSLLITLTSSTKATFCLKDVQPSIDLKSQREVTPSFYRFLHFGHYAAKRLKDGGQVTNVSSGSSVAGMLCFVWENPLAGPRLLRL